MFTNSLEQSLGTFKSFYQVLRIFNFLKAKNGVFYLNYCLRLQKLNHNIGFLRKMPIFRGKLAKIAENCDHNIDPFKFSALSEFATHISHNYVEVIRL
jgi:hypothetical protein